MGLGHPLNFIYVKKNFELFENENGQLLGWNAINDQKT